MKVLRVVFNAENKMQMVQSLALAFERNEFQWLKVPVATAELVAYESRVSTTTGRISYSAPEGANDDTVTARMLLNYAVHNKPAKILWAG